MEIQAEIHNPEPTTIKYHPTMGVPVQYFLDAGLMPDETAINELKLLSQIPGVDHHIAALPDLHSKGRNLVPTGLVTVSKSHIIPFAVDKGINCGIRIMALPFTTEDFGEELIDPFFKQVMKWVPGHRHPNSVINKNEVKQILLKGAEWAIQNYDISEDDLRNIEKNGNMFRGMKVKKEAILRSLPGKAFKKGRKSLGVLGGGNHFLELQKIDEIADPELAKKLGLSKNQLVMMLHSGTGGVGGAIMKYFHQVAKKHGLREKSKHNWEKIKFLKFFPWDTYRRYWFKTPHLYAIPAQSATARHFIRAVYAVANYGFVNRMMISFQVERALQHILRDNSVKVKLLFDSSHVTVQQENHKGEMLWVHRNGANQAMPPSAIRDHPVYRETGQPIPIPGSMGTDSYIGVAAEGAIETFCSANHGAGRLLDKPEARKTFAENGVISSMKDRGIRLYRYGRSPITDQAPEAFKDIKNVVKVMEAFNLAKPVARVKPIAVLKG